MKTWNVVVLLLVFILAVVICGQGWAEEKSTLYWLTIACVEWCSGAHGVQDDGRAYEDKDQVISVGCGFERCDAGHWSGGGEKDRSVSSSDGRSLPNRWIRDSEPGGPGICHVDRASGITTATL